MGGKYQALTRHLEGSQGDLVQLSFARIEELVGFSLPASARRYQAWWSNSPSEGRHSASWLQAGWLASDLNLKGGTITFKRSGASHAPHGARTAGVRGQAFQGDSLGPGSLTARSAVSIGLKWKNLGTVELEDGALRFPPAPRRPGIYLMVLRQGNASTIYIGETSELRRRFANYRSPGPTQQTNLRLNQILQECLISGGKVAIDVAYDEIELSIGGVVTQADLADKATRRLAEHAALVAHGGVDVEKLNR